MVPVHDAPAVLWSLRGHGRDVRCLKESARGNFELRILWGDDLFLTETFQTAEKLLQRAEEFRTTLEARGWTPLPAREVGPPTPSASAGAAETRLKSPAAEIGSAVEAHPAAEAGATSPAQPEAGVERPLVLVVDDERVVRNFMRSYLEAAQYAVREAEDVDSALSALDEGSVDAVVLDVRMPDRMGWGRTGLEVLAFMRLHADYEDLPVLILTAHGMTDEERNLVVRHRADLFMKPDGYRQLLERLNDLTGHTPGALQQC
jgi:CheY-like chemotaxis protein